MELNFMLACAAVVAAGFVRGFSGFGAGMILVPSLSILYSPIVAVVSVVLMELVPSIQLVPSALRRCHWRSLLPMALTAVVTVPLGSLLLIAIDEQVIRVLISFMVLSGAAMIASGWQYQMVSNNNKAPMLTGAVSGLLTGAIGLGGIPVIMYYLSARYKADVTRASMVIFLFVTVVISLFTFIYHGIITQAIILRCLSMAPLLMAATWAGEHMFGQVSETTFRTALLLVLSIMGVMTLLL